MGSSLGSNCICIYGVIFKMLMLGIISRQWEHSIIVNPKVCIMLPDPEIESRVEQLYKMPQLTH